MSDLTKSSKKLVREVYTYTFDENLTTSLITGSNATVGNLIFNLYDKDAAYVGYIMFSTSSRNISGDANYQNYQCGLFLNNNKDLLTISYCEVTMSNSESDTGTETLAKAIYGSGNYQGKDVTVNIKYLQDNKRKVIITYKE
jgi:hypothetical protein